MLLSLLLCLCAASAEPIAREWRVADRTIHGTCKGVNSPKTIIASFETQSLVVFHSRVLVETTMMGLETIRLQAEHDRLTSPARVEIALLALSHSVLDSLHRIDEQKEALDQLGMKLVFFREAAAEFALLQKSIRPRPWRKICKIQASRTSQVAWETYTVLMQELTRLQEETARVEEALTLTQATDA